MTQGAGDAVIRPAGPADVAAICGFGAAHIAAHYAPLIGAEAAAAQVHDWWNPEVIGAAVAAGHVVVAESAAAAGELAGVGQGGRYGAEHVVYKLYVHPGLRGRGLGRRLLEALVDRLPAGVDRLWIEHFAANVRAGAFYEREGFTVDRVEPGAAGGADADGDAVAVVWRVRRVGRVGGGARSGPSSCCPFS